MRVWAGALAPRGSLPLRFAERLSITGHKAVTRSAPNCLRGCAPGGTAQTVLNGYLNGIGGGSEKARLEQFKSAEAFATKHAWYPIPDHQIQLSQVAGKSNLTQNPGW